MPIRGDEPRIRQAGRPAFSYINKTTVFKRKQGTSRSSTVKRAIPANRAGLPLIKAGPLVVKTFLLTGWALPVTVRTTYALQEEKPRPISAQEISQLSTPCTVLPIYNFWIKRLLIPGGGPLPTHLRTSIKNKSNYCHSLGG